jgi:hypothetical protein
MVANCTKNYDAHSHEHFITTADSGLYLGIKRFFMADIAVSMTPEQVSRKLNEILGDKSEVHGTYRQGKALVRVDAKTGERVVSLVEHYGITDDCRTFRVSKEGEVVYAVREKVKTPANVMTSYAEVSYTPGKDVLFVALASFKLNEAPAVNVPKPGS